MTAEITQAPCPTEREQFEAWWESERVRTWQEAGCHLDRGETPSLAWSANTKPGAWRGWQAARAQAAPQGPAQYRLLQADIDTIEATDEFLSDDTMTWAVDPGGVFVGMPYAARVLRPARRAIKGDA